MAGDALWVAVVGGAAVPVIQNGGKTAGCIGGMIAVGEMRAGEAGARNAR